MKQKRSPQPLYQRPTPAEPPPVHSAATTRTDAPASGTAAATAATEPVATTSASNPPAATAVTRSVASGHANQPQSERVSADVASAPPAATILSASLGWVMRWSTRGWRESTRAVRRLCISGPLLVGLAAIYAVAHDGLALGWAVTPIAQILPAQGGQQVPIAQNLDQVLTGLRNLLMLYLVPVTIVILTAAWMRYAAARKAENAEQAKEAVSKALIGFCGAALSPVIVQVLLIIVRGGS